MIVHFCSWLCMHMITGIAAISVRLQRFHFIGYQLSQDKLVKRECAHAPDVGLISSFYYCCSVDVVFTSKLCVCVSRC